MNQLLLVCKVTGAMIALTGIAILLVGFGEMRAARQCAVIIHAQAP